tara:strand:- start:205 stop:486 length:282 start_codon:yes stop_codon:yes gene_type:complete
MFKNKEIADLKKEIDELKADKKKLVEIVLKIPTTYKIVSFIDEDKIPQLRFSVEEAEHFSSYFSDTPRLTKENNGSFETREEAEEAMAELIKN